MGGLEVVVVLILIVVLHGRLLGSSGVVNLGATGAASSLDNVVQVNLLETVLICIKWLEIETACLVGRC
jgi:hypothetical protein